MEFLIRYRNVILIVLQVVCWVITLLSLFAKHLSKTRKRALLLLEVSSALLLLAEVVFRSFNGNPSTLAWWAVRISKFALYLYTAAVLYSFNLYVRSLFADKGITPPILLRIAEICCYLEIAILIFSQFTGFSYVFDANNTYQRRVGRTIVYLITFFVLILQLVTIIIGRKNIRRRIIIPLFLFTLFPFLAAIVQFFSHDLPLVNMILVSMTIVLFIFTIEDMNEQVDRAHKLEIEMHEKYQKELEITVDERTKELRIANQKAENLLLNILPKDIAQELTEHPDRTISKKYTGATVLFTDIVGFTKMSSAMTAEATVLMLNTLTSMFDERAKEEGIEKIKTIGDAYMAATGLSEIPEGQDSSEIMRAAACKMCHFAQGLLADVDQYNKTAKAKIQIRIGINTGELVAGVIGKSKFIYDVWGDTVNVASRMESTGEPMKIHISKATHDIVKKDFKHSKTAKVEVKGKGLMTSYFL